MNTPAISVAMSVFNERFLASAIEFLILDGGSRHSTAEIIRDFAARDSRVRPILRENRGLIASLNELIEEARALAAPALLPSRAGLSDDGFQLVVDIPARRWFARGNVPHRRPAHATARNHARGALRNHPRSRPCGLIMERLNNSPRSRQPLPVERS